MLAALLYYARLQRSLTDRPHSDLLLLTVSYKIACDMYGLHVGLKTLATISGFVAQRLSLAVLASCQVLRFEFYIKHSDFDAFMQAFYSNSDLDEFLGENIETLLYAPRRLRTTCEKLDDDAWLQEQPII